VLAAQFAAVATLLSFFAFDERLTRRQLLGVVVILAGVTAVAALRA
jgi:drug/metabolite transporter (DMT)-like permease